jgi:GT2 family glycosyltransferase
VSYNGAKWIEKCLKSLCASSIKTNIIVIDNNSKDQTKEIIKTKFSHVELIESSTNLGFGKANNIGLKKAVENNADFVFLLNQDAWIESDTIEKLVITYSLNIRYGILSPIALDGTGNKLDIGFSTYIKHFSKNDLISDLFMNKLNDIYSISFVNAAGWLITKDCLQKVGGFDNLFHHYGEDLDYCQRAIYKGFSVGIVPSALYYHDRDQKTTQKQRTSKDLLISHLVDLKDLSKNYTFSFIKSELNFIKGLFISCFKFSFERSKTNLYLFIHLLKKSNQIKKSRLTSLSEKAFL